MNVGDCTLTEETLMKTVILQPEVKLLLHQIEESYGKKAWHGPNLRGSIRGLTAEQAAWRPGPGRRNIWEIVVHAAYWKYAVRRRLLKEKKGSFPLKGSNWFQRPLDASEEAWRRDVQLLESTHRTLREAIQGLSSRDLYFSPPTSKYPNYVMVSGIASHDVYHAGQIQLIKRLMKRA
jgi:uncharacterized damage-inducible protein DinB